MTRNLDKLIKWVDARLGKGVSKVQRQILVNYKIALDDIRKELSKVYEKYASGGTLTYAEMTKYHRLKNLHDQLTGIMGPTLSKNGKLVEKLSEVQYEESFFLHSWAVDQSAGVSLRWGLLNEAAVKAAVEGQGWRELYDISIKGMKQDALVKLDRVITQGLIKGSPYEKMARAIKKEVMEASARRAMTIAQTEAHRAQVLGQLASAEKAEELGIALKRVWNATLDTRTRPSHAQMDGQEADEDGEFHAPWGSTKGPGVDGPPEEVINCRCSVTERIDGYGPKVRRARDEGIIPYTTFTDWAKERGISKNIYGQEY